ncbi:MAG: hypothetical protein HC837_17955, partial [Chloroflexaceae bacterium]|nr:hypothetical protein [Chloroflexaceae bacterium]
EQPQPEQPQPATDVSVANPLLIPYGAPLQVADWTFTNPGFMNAINGPIGSFNPSGRFIVVFVNVANGTGQDTAIPANFLVIKDAQGRVYDSLPAVSTAYMNQFGGADQSQETPVPADTITRSVPLIYDVAGDASGLVFFSRAFVDQGWSVPY